MKILDRDIGPGRRPYLIAKLSGNHIRSLGRALEIVDAAAASVDSADTMQTNEAED